MSGRFAPPSGRDAASADAFHAVLRCGPKLSDPVFEASVITVLALALLAAVVLADGAFWPAGTSLGLAGLATATASVSLRAAGDRHEEVRACGKDLCVRRFRRGMLVDQRRFALERTSLVRTEDRLGRCRDLHLVRNGSRYRIAGDVSPMERDRFARALVQSIADRGGVLALVTANPSQHQA